MKQVSDQFEHIVPKKVLELVHDNSIEFQRTEDYNGFFIAYESFDKRVLEVITTHFDPRVNCGIWATDIFNLTNQILYEYVWMKSWAQYFISITEEGSAPSHYNFHVNLCADNCIIRIDSLKDKIALMIYSYYYNFNPQCHVPTYDEIVKKMIKNSTLCNSQELLSQIGRLDSDCFIRLERYRHNKIHKLEPSVELFSVKPHHGVNYYVPMKTDNQKRGLEKRLSKSYGDKYIKDVIRQSCIVDGVLIDRIPIEDLLWDFDVIREDIDSCVKIILTVMKDVFLYMEKLNPFDCCG